MMYRGANGRTAEARLRIYVEHGGAPLVDIDVDAAEFELVAGDPELPAAVRRGPPPAEERTLLVTWKAARG